MSEFGLGQKINSGLDSLNDARKQAQTTHGNEAIIREKDGSYSLYKISDSSAQEKSILKNDKSINEFMNKQPANLDYEFIEVNIEEYEFKNEFSLPDNFTTRTIAKKEEPELGENIKSGFTNIDSAREAIKKGKLNAFIVKENDGTYSLYKIGKNNNAENKLLENKHLLNDYFNKPSLRIVEVGIGSRNLYTSIRNEDYSKEELVDSLKIGRKISDVYIDNHKENKFFSLEQAFEAGKLHEGDEAIVKNEDGSFSLYRVTEEQMNKIRNDKNYSGNIVRFILSDILGNEQMLHTNPADDALEPEDNLIFIDKKSLTDCKEKKAFKDFEAASKEMAAKMTQISELKDLGVMLAKINSGEIEITPKNMNQIKRVLDLTNERVNSGKQKLTGDEKKVLDEFTNIFNKTQDSFSKYAARTEAYNESLGNLNEHIKFIVQNLEGRENLTEGEKLIVKRFKEMLEGYSEIMNGSDLNRQAIFQAFMAEVANIMEKGGDDGFDEINKLIHTYTGLERDLNTFNETGKVPDKNRFNLLLEGLFHDDVSKKSPQLLKLKTVFNNAFNQLNGNKPTKKGNNTFVGLFLNDRRDNPKDIKPTKKDFQNVINTACRRADGSTVTLKQSFVQLKGLNIEMQQRTFDLIEARSELNDSINKLEEILQDPTLSKLFKNSIMETIASLQKEVDSIQKELDSLDDIINQLIKSAREMQDKLDLAIITPKEAKISTLMENLRNIISNLDDETREMLNKKLSSKLIDQNFSRYIKENQDKIKIKEELRIQLNKIFNDSKEVKEAKIPMALKQRKQDDISAKMALIALNQVQ